MPNYTVTTTAVQDALLAWVTANYNTEHDTTLLNSDYINLRFQQLLDQNKPAYTQSLTTKINARFAVVSPSVQNQVLTLLGVTP